MPVIAIAPILVVWFGFGIGPKLAIIALVCFFPITVNALDGLRSVDPDQVKMMRTLDAGRWQILRRVEAPTALPFAFSGAKIAVAVAVIGAVFGEWAGSGSGLGHLMLQSSAQLQTARLFAAIVVLSAIAIVFFGLLALAERRVVSWKQPEARTLEIDQARPSRRPRTRRPRPRRLRRKRADDRPDPPGPALRRGARLLRQRRPRGHLHGNRARLLQGRRARRQAPRALRPGGADQGGRRRAADLAISYEPEVLLAQAQGLDVKAVAAIVNQPLTSLISLPSAGIAKPSDLGGKTVATAGIPYQQDYLNAILDKAGVPSDAVSVTNVGLNLLPALLGGKADAILGGFQNIEGVQLQQQGANPVIVNVKDLGVPTYDELVLVAKGDRLASDPEPIRLFIQGLEKGTQQAVADPAAATQAVLSAGQGLDPKLTRAEVDATLPLLLPAQTGKNPKPYGYMDPAQWEAFAGFLAANGSISDVPSTDSVLTNDLLPPAPK